MLHFRSLCQMRSDNVLRKFNFWNGACYLSHKVDIYSVSLCQQQRRAPLGILWESNQGLPVLCLQGRHSNHYHKVH